jgi:pyrroline-5-carboxylate reductase
MAQTSPVPKLQIVGGGKMGEALLSGLIASGWASADDLRVVEVVPQRAAELSERISGLKVTSSPGKAAGHVLAVKPHDIRAACADLATESSGDPVLSIAAGVTLTTLEAALPEGTPVVRAMPNTPSLVGAGAAAIAPGRAAGPDELAWAEQVLGAVGTVVRVDEGLLDAVTGVSGSGPAYVFLVAEAMTEAGVLAGLPRPTSAQLVVQTLVGAAKLLAESDSGPEALRAAVTSPGGTTASGLRALEQAGTRAAFLDAVMAAAERSRQLGG